MRIKCEKLGLGEARAVAVGPSDQLLALDEALKQLEEKEPCLSRIVELRFFGDLSEEETGEVLGISVRTVKRDWSMAKAWLYQQITLLPIAGNRSELVAGGCSAQTSF